MSTEHSAMGTAHVHYSSEAFQSGAGESPGEPVAKPVLHLPREVHVVGAGGTGSWVVPCIARLLHPYDNTLHIWDGDKLEQGNLDRQLYDEQQVGQNKAAAMKHGLQRPSLAHSEYFHDGCTVGEGALLISCADNHTARRAVLAKCDEVHGYAIIAGNEYIDAEAYYYEPAWGGSLLDPRIFAPEMATDTADDPRRPAGCTGAAQRATPQLVIANMTSASCVMRLVWFWFAVARQACWQDDEESRMHFPTAFYASAFKSWAVTMAMALDGRRQ